LAEEVKAPFLRIDVTTEISSLPTKGMFMGIFNNSSPNNYAINLI
jgi:hypothetical protein